MPILKNTALSKTLGCALAASLAIVILIIHAPAALANASGNAHSDEIQSGQIIANANGRQISLPLLKMDYDVDVNGHVATVSLMQTFINPGSIPLNAKYLFPLNQKAAVYGMEMKVGDEIVKAIIKRKEEAKKVFEKAKSEGKVASLLNQHRPNMFTQDVANLMPGKPVTITLRYLQLIPKIDDAYELVIPMVVGPRYEGKLEPGLAATLGMEEETTVETSTSTIEGIASEQVQVSGWNIDKLPAYPNVIGFNAPSTIDQNRITLNMTLDAATPISGVHSSTHALKKSGDENKFDITFENGKDIDNRDLILRYELSKSLEIAAGVLSHKDERGGFLSFTIEPPKLPAAEAIIPRELVFVLDTSGSMSGAPMNASKTFMRTALKNMRSDDYFRILRFANNTSHFAKTSLRATPGNLQRAQYFINGLSANGGTELNSAMNAAFDVNQPEDTMRIVVFLTDGYIGRDRQVIKTVADRVGNARVYAFGIGNSVNRFLLDGIAKEGRGKARYVGVGETKTEAAEALAADIQAPLLTDISIDWNGLETTDQAPARIPDLFAGGSINVLARYEKSGQHQIFLNGLVNGRKASMPIDINLKDRSIEQSGENSEALPLLWAREQIFDKNRAYTIGGNQNKSLKEQITELGLKFSLQSRFTSFVAVSQKVYNDAPANNNPAQVPLPKVSGISTNAYPSLNLGGSSTPEPETIMGMMVVFMIAMMRFWKNVRNSIFKIWSSLKSRALSRSSLPVAVDKRLPRSVRRDAWWIDT
ncbi:MAG: VWA domain-containing protein [Hyphomicrobiales bacterium]|nr:VWA domain-containing protein [Hyphomicrobiales bacterium]